MKWWVWLVTIAGGVSAIGTAVSAIAKWISPVVSVSDRLKEVELHDARDLKRFDRIDAEQERMHKEVMDELHEQRGAIITLLMQAMYGNHSDELKAQLTKIQNK